jgi:hypothetical protein
MNKQLVSNPSSQRKEKNTMISLKINYVLPKINSSQSKRKLQKLAINVNALNRLELIIVQYVIDVL